MSRGRRVVSGQDSLDRASCPSESPGQMWTGWFNYRVPAAGWLCACALILAAAACTAYPETPVPSRWALPTVAVAGCRGVGLNATLRGDPADPRVAWLVQGTLRIDV